MVIPSSALPYQLTETLRHGGICLCLLRPRPKLAAGTAIQHIIVTIAYQSLIVTKSQQNQAQKSISDLDAPLTLCSTNVYCANRPTGEKLQLFAEEAERMHRQCSRTYFSVSPTSKNCQLSLTSSASTNFYLICNVRRQKFVIQLRQALVIHHI